jgi:hypothetical protein
MARKLLTLELLRVGFSDGKLGFPQPTSSLRFSLLMCFQSVAKSKRNHSRPCAWIYMENSLSPLFPRFAVRIALGKLKYPLYFLTAQPGFFSPASH